MKRLWFDVTQLLEELHHAFDFWLTVWPPYLSNQPPNHLTN